MYGKKSEGEDDKLYLTDVDPYIYRDNKILLRIMTSALSEVERQSAHFNNPPQYQQIVSGFKQLVERIAQTLQK